MSANGHGFPCPTCGGRTRVRKNVALPAAHRRFRKCAAGCLGFWTREQAETVAEKPATLRKRISAGRMLGTFKGLSPKRRGLLLTIINSWHEEDATLPATEKGPAQ